MLIKALAFAAEKHRNQRRKDPIQTPYINHPIQLADVLSSVGGIHDTPILCAALLHDVIEDTDTTYETIRDLFTEEIADLVQEVTDDPQLKKAARKQRQIDKASLKTDKAKLISLADKICNIKDLYEHPPVNWSRQRQYEYFRWAHQVVAGLRGVSPELEALFDEIYEEDIKQLSQDIATMEE